jgi:anaerobic magnesium-protoporphyrin IX monomethyl ester cyclase
VSTALLPSARPSPGTASGLLDVCLVYLRTSQQGRLGTHAFDLVLPPLGLAMLAAVLEKRGFSVRVLDAFAEELTEEQTFARLRDQYRVVGFYCHTQNIPAIVRLARRLKAGDKPPYVIIGGPHANAMPAECLRDGPDIDAVGIGEGEATIVELVDCLLEGKDLSRVNGIYYRGSDGRILTTGAREPIQDLDGLPFPAWHLLPMNRYRSFIEAEGRKIIHIMGSRGCFNDCNYCYSTKMWGPKVRWHSAERTLQEMDFLKKHYGIEVFQFFDDNFTLDPRRLKVLMEEFRRRELKDKWVCSTRIDLLNEEAVRQLKHGGVHHVAIGMETVNDRLLKVINKNVTKRQTLRTMELCNKYGVRVMGMFIIGLPTETRAETMETIDFVRKSKLHLAVFSHLTVYPGTNFWPMLKDSPYLEKDFSRYSLAKNITYIEPGRSLEEIEALTREAYLAFYLKPRVILHFAWVLLKNPRQLWSALLGFSTVLYTLLFRHRSRLPELTHPATA